MARDRRIEQARERLRRLKPPPGSAGSRLDALRERARAARAAQGPGRPPPWTPPPAPPEQPAAASEEASDAAVAKPTPSADDSPRSVPFRPGGRSEEPAAPADQAPAPATSGKPSIGSRLRAGVAGTGEALSSGGHWVSDRWATLPAVGRARILAVVIVAAVAAVVWFIVLPSAPCAAPGGDECPPGDDAIALVPEDAVAYVHLDVDSGTAQFEAAQEIAARLPLLTQLAIADVSSLAGRPIDFDGEIRPWSGGEAALAVLPGDDGLEQVLMLEADDEDGAQGVRRWPARTRCRQQRHRRDRGPGR